MLSLSKHLYRPRPVNLVVRAKAVHGNVVAHSGSRGFPGPGVRALPRPGGGRAVLLGHEVCAFGPEFRQ